MRNENTGLAIRELISIMYVYNCSIGSDLRVFYLIFEYTVRADDLVENVFADVYIDGAQRVV